MDNLLPTAHLVVVDDEESRRQVAHFLLMSYDAKHISSVASVGELIEYLAQSFQQNNPVDLILMDVQMPGIDGIAGCRQIKNIPSCRHIPILMLTSMDDPKILREAFDAGALDYIRKTSDPIEFFARVNLALTLTRESEKLRMREQELIELTRQLMSQQDQNQQRTSYTDELTGLYHSSAYERIAKGLWDKTELSGQNIALVLVSLDFFSEYNMHHGKEQGDLLLKAVARILPPNDRQTFSIRLEGSIFAVILTEDVEREAPSQAEHILERMRRLRIPHQGSEVDVIASVSIGYTIQRPASAQYTDLLKIAQQALMEAGRQGHNRQVSLLSLDNGDPFRLI